MDPYIGITGFTKPEEVEAAYQLLPIDPPRKLMVGVLASWKTLRGIPLKPKWQAQFPDPKIIPALFPDDDRVLNLIHYGTEEGQESSLLADLLRLEEFAGENLHGFQLNIPWPSTIELEDYAFYGHGTTLALQIGRKAMEMVGDDRDRLITMLERYIGLVDAILLDPSGGLGQPFDTERARTMLRAIADRGWDLGLGVAGGLGPNTLHLVEPLLAEFPHLSIDAQGRLRNEQNELDASAVASYLGNAFQIFAGH